MVGFSRGVYVGLCVLETVTAFAAVLLACLGAVVWLGKEIYKSTSLQSTNHVRYGGVSLSLLKCQSFSSPPIPPSFVSLPHAPRDQKNLVNLENARLCSFFATAKRGERERKERGKGSGDLSYRSCRGLFERKSDFWGRRGEKKKALFPLSRALFIRCRLSSTSLLEISALTHKPCQTKSPKVHLGFEIGYH